MSELLLRIPFNLAVFHRDNKKCVNCGSLGPLDAHHIIDRKCFDDGGYRVDNGVTLCHDCHILAENGTLDPQYLRDLAGIKTILLPSDLDPRLTYDKWGNPTDLRVKYSRTSHLPWSPGLQNDDRLIDTTDV